MKDGSPFSQLSTREKQNLQPQQPQAVIIIDILTQMMMWAMTKHRRKTISKRN